MYLETCNNIILGLNGKFIPNICCVLLYTYFQKLEIILHVHQIGPKVACISPHLQHWSDWSGKNVDRLKGVWNHLLIILYHCSLYLWKNSSKIIYSFPFLFSYSFKSISHLYLILFSTHIFDNVLRKFLICKYWRETILDLNPICWSIHCSRYMPVMFLLLLES